MLSNPKVVLGVAAIRRKLYSAPMQALLQSLQRADPSLHLVPLDEHRMKHPISAWPVVDVLLTLYSTDFPIEKVLRYVDSRSPILINNLFMQPCMMDRRDIRRVLARAGVPTPPAVFLDRRAGDCATQVGPNANTLLVYSPRKARSYTIHKPFVEKPVDPDDHNVYIYYENGGVRKLFRKIKNQSSSYIPNETQVRQSGDYVYEQFYEPEHCADVKVYGVGDYFHAESRKAPHIDGIVDRDQRGKERRNPVHLTSEERDMCRRVASAFDQFVIGFDLLRGPGSHRFIIDVNGWSLVKNSAEYAERSGKLLADHIASRLTEREQKQVMERTNPLLRNSPQQSGRHSSSADLFDAGPGHSSTCVV